MESFKDLKSPVTHHTVQCCQLRSSPELGDGWVVCVPCKNWVVVVSPRVFKPPSCDACSCCFSMFSPLFVLLCADMFCWVLFFCAGVVAVTAEAKAEIEVDFGSCCSNNSNRLLCLRLYHIGNFQVHICRVRSYVMMWLCWALSTSLTPSCTYPRRGSLNLRCCQQRSCIFV